MNTQNLILNIDLNQVFTALRQANSETRDLAEQAIRQEGETNYLVLIQASIAFIAHNGIDEGNKQYCALILGKLIGGGVGYEKFENKWYTLNSNIRDNFKSNIFCLLGTASSIVRRNVSTCISNICKLEFPNGEFFEIIETLETASCNEDKNNKLAALMTIKNIVTDVNKSILSTDNLSRILNAVLKNIDINLDAEIRKEALLALFGSLENCKLFMESEPPRNNLMSIIYSSLQYKEHELQVLGFQCLGEITKHFYAEIAQTEHISNILKFTKNYIENLKALDGDEDKILTQIFLVWREIAEIECFNKNKGMTYYNVIGNNYIELFNLCVYLLSIRNSNENNDEYLPHRSVEDLLVFMNKICKEDLIDITMKKVQDLFGVNNLKCQHSAMLLFSTIIESVHIQKVTEIITEVCGKIINKMNDHDEEIRTITAHIFSKICKYHSPYLDPNILESIISFYIQKLMDDKGCKDKPTVVKILKGIHEIAKHCNLHNESSKF
jgi:hypothetical protein